PAPAERRPSAHLHARVAAPKPPVAPRTEAVVEPVACKMTVGSYPWADLWVDGADTGLQTPVVALPLACGAHRLEFKRKDLKVDQIENVTLNEGHDFKREFELQGAGLDE
ncbi:MAG TPA: hypothetical protein VHO06_24615, partial [Polyangia bacterium]|nr:hypothetical protein [Polyangia bacterium]